MNQQKRKDNMKEPLVSVIIPAHNEEETIGECIESFLNQTYQNLEIIVVDDGSTDNTYRIANKYPIRVIKLESTQGEAYARNIGIKAATGSIIVEAEGDGKYAPNYVETIIKPLNNPNVGGSIAGLRIVWSNKNNVLVRFWNKRWLAAGRLTLDGKRPVIGAWAFRKHVFEDVGLYDEGLPCGTDVDFVNRVKKAGYKIVALIPDNTSSESITISSSSYSVWKIPEKTYFYHKDPDTLRKLIKRTWWGAVNCKKFRERWNLEPKGIKKLFFIGRNIAALMLPVYLVLAFVHSILWLTFFFGVLFAESIFPILYDNELRLTFKLALKGKDYKLAAAMPFICWVEIRTRASGIFYAMLKKDVG